MCVNRNFDTGRGNEAVKGRRDRDFPDTRGGMESNLKPPYSACSI